MPKLTLHFHGCIYKFSVNSTRCFLLYVMNYKLPLKAKEEEAQEDSSSLLTAALFVATLTPEGTVVHPAVGCGPSAGGWHKHHFLDPPLNLFGTQAREGHLLPTQCSPNRRHTG